MESIWNKNHNPISDTFALQAIELARKHLPELRHEPSNIDLRTYLLRASLFAGLAFSDTKTALAHSISYPITAHFGLPHGLACALPLPHLIELNGVKDYGISKNDVQEICESAITPGRADNNIIEITYQDLVGLIKLFF